MDTQRLSQQGFTLVELSIVLVIIGLITGGVLVGQDMIESAKIKAQVRQIEEYDAALGTFRLKYGEIPGDCGDLCDSSANSFGLVSFDVVGTADSDGIIGNSPDATLDSTTPYDEGAAPMAMLAGAGLISGQNTAGFFPKTAINDSEVNLVSDYSKNLYWVVGMDSVRSGWTAYGGESTEFTDFSPALSGYQAWRIDSAIDDASPSSGSVRVALTRDFIVYNNAISNDFDSLRIYAGSPSPTISSDCADNSTGNRNTATGYVFSNTTVRDCPLLIRASH